MTKVGKTEVRYPWRQWFNRRRLTLQRYKHFDVEPYVIAQQFRNRAYRMGRRLSIQIREDQVHITFLKE